MSQENVEAVRAVFEEWEKGDLGAGSDRFDPNILMVLSEDFPDAGSYLTPAGLEGYTRGFLAAWSKLTIRAEELMEAGDSVVVKLHQQGVGRGSGAPSELRYFQVWTFRGEMVIRIDALLTRAEALEAVGLKE